MADGQPAELEVLLADEHVFDPPPEFTAQANASDPAIYDEAERDPRAGGRAGPTSSTGPSRGARCSTGTRRGRSGSWAGS